MNDVTIRAAKPDDATAIRRVARESWHAVYDGVVGEETVDGVVDRWYDTEGLRESTARDGDEFLVAERKGDSIVGFVHVAPIPDENGGFDLVRIYLVPEEWGAGLGIRLLDCAEERIRERGAERLRLTVVADNDRGVGFYESRDFERIEEREDAALGVQEYVYEKEL